MGRLGRAEVAGRERRWGARHFLDPCAARFAPPPAGSSGRVAWNEDPFRWLRCPGHPFEFRGHTDWGRPCEHR